MNARKNSNPVERIEDRNTNSKLFQPVKIGTIEASNRVFMAPMTRARGTREHVPTPIMVNYYAQRASAGLIISEAIGISQQGLGWPYATGLWSDDQVSGWRAVTDAVHAAGGKMIAQLWHMGRVVHPSFLGGAQPVSASVTTAPGQAHTYDGKQLYTTARSLRLDELPPLVESYEAAAKNAIAAGFDGVQVHAANGYLIDQFLRDGSNFRSDRYGGTIENRIRLLRDVLQGVSDAVGADRTGARLSPNVADYGATDSDPESLFLAAGKMLSDIGIAHLELREPPIGSTFGSPSINPLAPKIREVFGGILIVNSDYDRVRAEAMLEANVADAVTFGRPFISNPDFPNRLLSGAPLSKDDIATWYSQGKNGYDDYMILPS